MRLAWEVPEITYGPSQKSHSHSRNKHVYSLVKKKKKNPDNFSNSRGMNFFYIGSLEDRYSEDRYTFSKKKKKGGKSMAIPVSLKHISSSAEEVPHDAGLKKNVSKTACCWSSRNIIEEVRLGFRTAGTAWFV